MNADCVEFCPDGSSDYIVANYQLDEETKTKSGKIISLSGEHEVKQVIDTGAVFDLKWSRRRENHQLAVVDASGWIRTYQMREKQLVETGSVQIPGQMLIALDWQNTESHHRIAVTASDGTMHLVQVDSTGALGEVTSFQAHDLEVWSCAWQEQLTSSSTALRDLLWTGADDSKLKAWDVRSPLQPVMTSNEHSAGVCTIVPFSSTSMIQRQQGQEDGSWLLATGSYDEKFRLFDLRFLSESLQEIPVIRRPLQSIYDSRRSGGVWRIRSNPMDSSELLLCCMHGGFEIVTCRDNKLETQHHITEPHSSLAYGGDWQWGQRRVGLCSFYDRQCSVWSYQ